MLRFKRATPDRTQLLTSLRSEVRCRSAPKCYVAPLRSGPFETEGWPIKPEYTNSRSKDVYDLSLLLPKVDINDLKKAIEKSFKHRGTKIPESFLNILKQLKTSRLESGWANALSSVADPPTFQDCFEKVLNLFKSLEQQK